MKYLLILFLSTIAIAGSLKTNNTQLFNSGFVSQNFIINPSGEKNATLGLSISGLTFTRTTTTPLGGMSDFTITSANSGEFARWSLTTPTQDLKGQNCEARATFTGDGTKYNFELLSGTTSTLSAVAFTNEPSSRDISINYPCGDLSDTRTVQVVSTAAGATFRVAKVYYGKATNIGTVAQSQFVGSSVFGTATSCIWTRTNAAVGPFDAVSACPAPTITSQNVGTWLNTDYDLPKQTINNLPPGNYLVKFTGQYSISTGTPLIRFYINDGTTTSERITTQAGTNGAFSVEGVFTYTTAQSSVSFQLYGSADSGQLQLLNRTGEGPVKVEIYSYPTQSQTAVRVDQSNFDYTSKTFTLSNTGNGTVSARGSRDGDKLFVNGTITIGSTTPTGTIALNMPSDWIIDTSKTSGLCVGIASGGNSGGTGSYTGCLRVDTSSTLLFYGDANAGVWNATVPRTFAQNDRIDFSFVVAIVGWTSNQNAPLLVGSVTSGTSGMERIERLTASSAPAITRQSGDWITGITKSAAGTYTASIKSGVFSGIPTCTCTSILDANYNTCSLNNISTSAFTVYLQNSFTGTYTDNSYNVICIGQR